MSVTQYSLKRLGLIIPTLLGILVLNFAITQFAPGGPVESAIAKLQGMGGGFSAQMSGTSGSDFQDSSQGNIQQNANQAKGSQGLPIEIIQRLEKQYGFDQPWYIRFWRMVKNYAVFDFGNSYYADKPIVDMIIQRMPVSISLGLWSTLLTYLISIPLGIAKAVRHGSRFDVATSMAVIVGYAIPGFIFAILLVILFAGGQYFDWFPLRGLTSDNFAQLTWWQQILDYAHHITLPTLAMVIGNFATLTMLTKNSFLDEIHKQYVVTAQAKGCSHQQILYGHVFRNAMLIVVAGMPAALIGIFFTSGLLVEYIFSLEGIGLMSFNAVISRDYPVVFGTLYIFSLMSLVLKLISDLTYVAIDPRIDFGTRL